MTDKVEFTSILNFYYKNKFSFFPLPYGEKKDDKFKWGEFQKRRPTKEETRVWFGNGNKHNVAVVCGHISGNLTILDCDSEERFYELSTIICEKLGIDDILDFTRISQTGNGCHIWLFTDEPTLSVKFPKLDIKGEGGYIVAPPSLHPKGTEYKFINPKISIKHIHNLLDIGIDLKQRDKSVTDSVTGLKDTWITRALQGISEGDRNDIGYKLASHFKNSQPIDITESLMLEWNKKNKPPLDKHELIATIRSAYKNPPLNNPPLKTPPLPSPLIGYSLQNSSGVSERDKSVTDSVTLSDRIEDWIKDTNGWFGYDELDKDLGIGQSRDKDNRRQIIKRLKDAGIIEAHPKQNKLFRYINTAVRLIDFKFALGRNPLDIKYPFMIEKYFKTYPGNIIVVAGAPDAGKTAFLLNLIRLNQYDFSIYYQSSEMGQDELANRLSHFEDITIDKWSFTAEERSSNFVDVIRPDCVNIIDYMEITDEFYLVAEYLKQIHEKLSSGIAIVALQKDPKADQGRGGIGSLEKPRLYLNLDAGKIVIRKAKNWTNPLVNPNRLELKFKIVSGCKFIVTEEWEKPIEF